MSGTVAIPIAAGSVDGIPGVAELLGGDLNTLWRRELARVVRNLHDGGDPTIKRSITITLALMPEADLQSCILRIERVGCKLQSWVPVAQRLAFRKAGLSLRATAIAGDRPQPPGDKARDAVDTEGLPGLDAIMGGALDDMLRREVAKALLNIDDPRAEPKALRRIKITISVSADADLAAMRFSLSGLKFTPAVPRPPTPGIVFFERVDGRIVTVAEPSTVLPDGSGGITRGRQNALDLELN